MAAVKVGVGEEEYASFCADFRRTQNSFIRQIETIKSKIEAVNCRDGGFYVENVTPNVAKLLSALDIIQDSIEMMQDSENEMIDSFERAIDNIDTCC
ncbi:MAG: hypothetical protein ACI4AA_02780 [Lachnospiraceae bacterium]